MAGRKQELLNSRKTTILLDQWQYDKLIELYGKYGVSRILRRLISNHFEDIENGIEPYSKSELLEYV